MTGSPDNSLTASGPAVPWQMPLLLLGLLACGAAVAVFVISGPQRDWEAEFAARVAEVNRVRDGNYAPVARQVEQMLSPAVTPSDQYERRARLHGLMAEIRWRSLQETPGPTTEQWEGLRQEYQRALQLGLTLSADAAERLGEAAAATGDVAGAVERFKQALERDPQRRTALLRRIIQLRQGLPGASVDEQLQELRAYLAAEGLDAAQYAWGVGRAVDLLIDADRLHDAAAFIADEQSRGLPESFALRLGYHRARVLARRGLIDQADNLLISLIGQLPSSVAVRHRCELLRGQLIWRDNPAEAVTLFEHVVNMAGGEPMATAARVGLAQAYGRLQLAERSLAACERAVEDLGEAAAPRQVNIDELKAYLAEAGRDHTRRGEHALALRFVQAEREVADVLGDALPTADRLDMLGRLAAAHRAVAETLASSPDADDPAVRVRCADHFTAAGEVLEDLATLAGPSDSALYGDSLWTAAAMFDQAGRRKRAITTLERFVEGRPGDERIAEARFLLGRALQAAGRYDDAIEVYQANLRARAPVSRHVKAVEGLIPMAQCYIAKGEDFFDEAERVLRSVISGRDEVTPESVLYRKALFGLGRLYHRQGTWRLARRVLDEAVKRDPGELIPLDESDPERLRWRYVRATRSMYLIAESYQNSARERLRASVGADADERVRARRRAHEQLRQADALFAQVIERLEAMDGPPDPLDAVVRRNAYFARGDCLYEMGDYGEALDRYNRAVHVYQHRREALGGLTAIQNCYRELGRLDQARAAGQRAQELRKQLPPDDGGDDAALMGDWNTWFETVGRLDPHAGRESRS
ncbi:MAG: tetratricopeptide repeat protein [Planctomycetota bacterium]